MSERPETGTARQIAPGVRVVLAGNPSPMTHWGTNTYLVGTGEIAVIDPGPADADHLAAVLAAAGAPVRHILVTHAHADHSAGAAALSAATGAPVLAFGPAGAGRDPFLERLSLDGLSGGGEGNDAGFAPDARLADGARVAVDGMELRALHMPGHYAGHLCFALGDLVFSGDLAMGWASTLISPPDGDLGGYLASMERLRALRPRRLLPGHGAPVEAPDRRLAELIGHRHERTRQIMAALTAEPRSLHAIAAGVYRGTPEALMAAARRNAFAHLIELVRTGRAQALPRLAVNAGFRLR